MTDSQKLLTEYVQTGSETAFRELVTRYLDLVYSTALRLVEGDKYRAEDVAQTVFVDLARKARTLSNDVMPGGWLHRHTCFVAANTMRSERRRQSRERQAVEMNALQENSGADYSLVAPILDDAINQLGDADRTAILLRFFEQRDFRSVGEVLGSNEDAARMRVTRALEKLHSLLKCRGVTTSAAALTIALSANAIQAAPVGLAVTISTAAVLAGTAVHTSTVIAATKAIAMTTLQKTLITVTITAAVGTGIYEVRQASSLRTQNQLLQQQQAPLTEQIQQLQRERDDATNRMAGLLAENLRSQSNPNQTELLKLRGEVGMLRQKANDLAQLVRDLQNAGKPNPSAYQTNFSPLGSLQFAGYATPEAALQSGLWAKSVGNEKVWLDGMAPDVADGAKNKYVQGQSDAERSQFLINQTTNWIGSRILNEIPLADDEVLMPTEIEMLVNGATNTFTSMEVLKRINGEWKLFDEYNENGLKPKAP